VDTLTEDEKSETPALFFIGLLKVGVEVAWVAGNADKPGE
jgi:hypothetical protein